MEFNEYVSDTTLNIKNVELTLKDIQDLVGFLQGDPCITHLNLLLNDIGVEGAKALAESSHLTNLTSLNLFTIS